MDRTEKGLRQKLEQSDYPPEAIEAAIAYVKSYGYIDDYKYAQHYISYRLGIKSKDYIIRKLYERGVDRHTAMEAWEEVTSHEEVNEQELIRTQVEKKCKGRKELDPKEMQRLKGFLLRQGFHWGDISAVLQEEKIYCKT